MRRLAPLAAALLLVFAPRAHAIVLPDSTVAESWKLANGLEVRTRHVAGAPGVAITLAVRAGHGYEPAGQEGLADLLSELAFTGPAGDFPERTRAEIASQRPLGYETRVTQALARCTEIVTPAQLPGALAQAAARMGGVQGSDAILKQALADVRRDAGARYFGEPANALYWRSGAILRGASDAQLVRLASLSGLSKLSAKDASAKLREWYQPGGACLALAGDLSGIEVRALVEATFGKLAAGPGLPDTTQSRLSGTRRVSPYKGLTAPVGVVASAAPALTDSLHPGFFLGMLITGGGLTKSWGPPTPPLAARFQYSLLDEPEIVRFYPPVRSDATDPDLLSGALFEQFQVIGGQLVMLGIMNRVRDN
ncbi:MAG: hypothetical protein K8R56_01210, partial [Candidatus Eisenbacteria bacterium]|nr:hypothetical protein [Candidatus Eisenbacteria bacterium]